jgi:hypothetical protein
MQTAARLISERKHTIFLVGDSLMQQRFFAMNCIFEQFNVDVDVRFWWSSFLDHSLSLRLCWLLNDTSYKCTQNNLPGVEQAVKNASSYSVIINTGSWHNKLKSDDQRLYEFSLNGSVASLLRKLQNSERCVGVYWIDNAPTGNAHKYGWSAFASKDHFAKAHLPEGVVFLNSSQATRPRKDADPATSVDGLHWCNPGKSSIPVFIAERILHLLAYKLTNP